MRIFKRFTARETVYSTGLLYSIVVLTVLIAFLLINTYHGDPGIYLIYAKNIAKGDWFAYNPHEFSSGCTSPLWAVVLSSAFLLPASLFFVKIITMGFTLAAIYLTYRTSYIVSKSKIGSIFGTVFIFYSLIQYGLLGYESPLIIILINLIVAVNYKLFHELARASVNGNHRLKVKSKSAEISNEQINRRFLYILMLWAAIPLVRPDAAIVVIINFLVILTALFSKRYTIENRRRIIAYLVITAILSSLPSLLFFAYSYIKTGTLSTSSYCRSFGLSETAKQIGRIKFSIAPIEELLSFPYIFWLVLAFWAWRISDDFGIRKTGMFSFLVVITYIVTTSLIFPIAQYPERYLLPLIPFILPISAVSFSILWDKLSSRKDAVLMFIFIALVALYPIIRVFMVTAYDKSLTLSFDKIFEKNVISHVNNIVEPNTIILAYEVQDRYYLRKDVRILSLDGIIDGKVAPYLSNSDMVSFLLKYRPNYWLANDAVNYRPYLAKSILKQVVDSIGSKQDETITLNGIKFTNIYIVKEPLTPGFASTKQIIRIDYDHH